MLWIIVLMHMGDFKFFYKGHDVLFGRLLIIMICDLIEFNLVIKLLNFEFLHFKIFKIAFIIITNDL